MQREWEVYQQAITIELSTRRVGVTNDDTLLTRGKESTGRADSFKSSSTLCLPKSLTSSLYLSHRHMFTFRFARIMLLRALCTCKRGGVYGFEVSSHREKINALV